MNKLHGCVIFYRFFARVPAFPVARAQESTRTKICRNSFIDATGLRLLLKIQIISTGWFLR